ncbi:MAG: peptidoglycan bridge formation glycyltransferase FemA/FemB family protein [Oscillospiraceae bacterium]|nr:peptidoglycan bridge formation glycyltransferase FemA/FemB family protein [Oscillospiraceae bacterium]
MAEYSFKSNISTSEYRSFLNAAPSYCFTQLPEWSQVKDNWGNDICALYKDGTIIAGALLLIRSLPLGKKIIYSPRGPVMDFNDVEAVSEFCKGLKNYAKKIGAIAVKIDPFIINESFENQQAADFGNTFDQTIDVLKKNGFEHRGLSRDINAYFQPRFNMAIPLFDDNGYIDSERFLKTMPKKTRYYMGSFHNSKGIEFIKSDSTDDLSEFVRLLSQTEKRQGISLRNEEYFKKILNAYGDRAVIYYAQMHLDKYSEYLNALIEKKQNIPENTKKLDEAKALIEERGTIINLAASLVIMPDKQSSGVKIAEYLYAGSDLTVLPTLCASVGLIYAGVCDSIDAGCDYFNLGGVDGSFEDHLSKFKLKFSPHIFEFVGEFDMAVNKPLYFAFEKLLPVAKKAIKKIKR